MRDRLIELIAKSGLVLVDGGIHPDTHLCQEALADYLLAEGVIVPRFKKGDKIYYISAVGNIIENKVYYVGGYTRALCYNADNKPLLDNVFLDTRVNEEYYLTKEEAEKALAERSEK